MITHRGSATRLSQKTLDPDSPAERSRIDRPEIDEDAQATAPPPRQDGAAALARMEGEVTALKEQVAALTAKLPAPEQASADGADSPTAPTIPAPATLSETDTPV